MKLILNLTRCNNSITICNMNIIEMAKQAQRTEGLTDSEFASGLSISRGQWNRIKHGGKFGVKFIRNLTRKYPGLKKEADIFLYGDVTKRKVEIK